MKIFSGSSARCTLYTCFVFIFWVEGVWGFRIRGCFEFKGLWGKGYGDAGVIEVCPGDWCLVCLPSLSLSCLVLCGWGDLAAAALAHDGDLLVEGVHHRDRPLRHTLPGVQVLGQPASASTDHGTEKDDLIPIGGLPPKGEGPLEPTKVY